MTHAVHVEKSAPPRQFAVPGWALAVGAIASIVGLASGSSARAQVALTGQPDAIALSVTQVSIREVLDRLATAYKLELHGTEDLYEKVSGTYAGNLPTVVRSVLGARNHVLITNKALARLFVLDAPAANRPSATPAALSASPQPLTAEAEKPKPIARPPAVSTLSPQGQQLAQKLFGERGRTLQVDETLLNSFAAKRGGRRFLPPSN